MRYDSFFNHALDDLYCPAALVSAVILFFLFLAAPAQANYVYNPATGQWTPSSRTVIAPPGSGTMMNYIPRDTPPTVSSTNDFINKTGGTFGSPPVSGTSRNVPVTINGTTTKPNVNRALLGRLGKGGLAGIALGAGIDALLDGIGALIDEGGTVNRIVKIPPTENYGIWYSGSNHTGNSPKEVFDQVVAAYPPNLQDSVLVCTSDTICAVSNPLCGGTCNTISRNMSAVCPPPYVYADLECAITESVPFPPNDLEDAINAGYQPHPSDYPFLAPDPAMQPTIVEVEPIPRLNLPPTTTTTIDLDSGKTTTVETNIWHDFNIKDNNTDQPKIEVETTTKTDTFVDGDKTSETTITNNTGFANPEGAYDSAGNRLDIPPPVDCDLFPTACAWMEWTQEEPDEPDDDLSELLQEVPIVSETFTITGGAATCPAPLVLNLSQFGSREVSYQPLCDLASTMKFLYLALMSFAAAVLLHRSISRV